MKKIALLLLILLNISSPVFAINEPEEEVIHLPEGVEMPSRDINNDGVIDKYDLIINETEEEFFNFSQLTKPVMKEGTLYAKIKASAQKAEQDTNLYLLNDLLTVDYDKGPVDRVHYYAKYRGNLSFNFFDSDLDTEYNTTSIDVGMIGKLNPEYKTDFKLQLKFTPTKDFTFFQQLISDAYIVNSAIPHHKIMLGNSRNQVGVEGGMSTSAIPFVVRSQIARTFGNTRAFGARLIGNYSLVDYSFAANSSDRYFKEFFPGAEFTGWVNFKPLGLTNGKYGKLVIGGGLSAGKNHNQYTIGGAYVGYTYKNFMANAEYSIADGYNGRVESDKKATGFYTTIGYKITPKIQIVSRFDQFDPNRDITGDIRREYSAGINYFIIGQSIKVLLNYVYCDNQQAKDSHRIILGTQLLL